MPSDVMNTELSVPSGASCSSRMWRVAKRKPLKAKKYKVQVYIIPVMEPERCPVCLNMSTTHTSTVDSEMLQGTLETEHMSTAGQSLTLCKGLGWM